MPKRGGRKSHPKKGKGDGGGSVKYGRIRSNKNKKRTGNGSSKNLKNIDIPELMDLEGNVYIPEIDTTVSKNSMRNLSRRPGRHHLYEEVGYTDTHLEDTLRQPLRNRPIEFVKAKNVYDPSAVLFKKLDKNNIPEIHQELLDIMKSPPQTGAHVPDSPIVDVLSEDTDDDAIDEHASHLASSRTSIDSEHNGAIEIVNTKNEGVAKAQEDGDDKIEEESESELSLEESMHEENEADVGYTEEDEAELFVIDNSGDSNILRDYSTAKPVTSSVIQCKREIDDSGDAQKEYNIEHDPFLNIGKVSLHTKKDLNGQTTAELFSLNPLNKASGEDFVEENNRICYKLEKFYSDISDDDIVGYKEYIAQVIRGGKHDVDTDEYESETNFDLMASSSEDDEEEEDEEEEEEEKEGSGNEEKERANSSEIEYGFLPEDYEFDVSQVLVSNVRFGIKNQFYTRCSELTGSDEQFMWIDEDDLMDYVLLKGVKEHRLRSFTKFITNGLIDEEQFDTPNYSDVYISETSEDELDDEENIADLIAFTKSQQQNFTDLDIPPTESIKTKGKGKKKQLDLERMQLDIDIHDSLQDQYQLHRHTKKNKKQKREDARLEEGLRKHDLLVKYTYSLHIKDICFEFDTFLHDSSRDSMSFPPLDPHGNKTITKLAKFYNMKSLKCGSGLKLFIKVSKNRKTFHYLPRYDQIGNVSRQRPIFNRTDQKRSKEEIDQTDGNPKKDKSRGRNRSQVSATREGDIVGASAPEIDSNNIGRKLLEKLGWTKGEGLGAHGNKGISEPVVAKIKKSKTGLK